MNFVALDLGGSGGKIFLASLAKDKCCFKEIHRFANAPRQMGGGLYWDFVYIYSQMVEGLRKAVHETGDAIESLAIDSFSNDFGIVDRNGELISPVRCYRDSRTTRLAAELDAIMSPAERHRLTGNQNAPFNTLMHLGAMRLSGQDWMLRNGTLLFVPDLLNYFMTGVTAVEYTIASVSQMYSFVESGWSADIIAAYDIPVTLLPKIVLPGTVRGKTTDAFNRQVGSRGFKVVTACEHDTASAFLSSIAPRGSAIISSGTWSLMGMELQGHIINDETCRLNFANEGGYPGRHRFLHNAMGSWIIQELRREWTAEGTDYSYGELDGMAAQAEPFRHLIDVDDSRFFSPGRMREKIVSLCREQGGSVPRSPGEFVRCVQECLALRFRWILEKLELLTGTAVPAVNMLGGGSRGEFACRLIADACERTVFAGPEEATALGNISVQLSAAGIAESLDAAKTVIVSSLPVKKYDPITPAAWLEPYHRWLTLTALN
jgi:sugar (pentulose or hexulose) kinase